jgi:hypothetical protein
MLNQKVKMMNKKTEALMKTLTTEEVAVIHSAFEDTPRTVAFIAMDKTVSDGEKCETAFMLTNSIDNAWYTSDKVNYVGPKKSCRSTSVGDFVLIGKTKYECKPAGWSKV